MADIGTRLLAVTDAAAAVIQTAWAPSGNNAVNRKYVTRENLNDIVGRQVYVMPAGAMLVEKATRGSYRKEFRVSVRIIERYTDPGLPIDSWLDDRVKFVGQYVHDALILTDQDKWLLGLFWTETLEITDVINVEMLLDNKTFWAEVEVAFRGDEP